MFGQEVSLATHLQLRVRARARAPLLLAMAMLGLPLSNPSAYAYTNQEWRVVGIWHGNSWIATGPATIFSTKQDALSTMWALLPSDHSDKLTDDAGITAMSQQWVRYKYIYPFAAPTYTPWIYNQGYSSSEEDWVAQVVAEWTNSCTESRGGVIVEAIGDWFTSGPGPIGSSQFWATGEEYQSKYYKFHTHGCSAPDPISRTAFRQRTHSCPIWIGLGNIPYQCNEARPRHGYIEGRVMECPATEPSRSVGNPCDVATGDKSQTATDYSANGLTFSRHYHSASLDASSALGVGWTHNYAARLLISGTVPVGLKRPSGYHDVLSFQGGQYVSLSGSSLHAQQSGSEWIISLGDGSAEVYDASGNLIRMIDGAGRTTTLTYASNRLASVVGHFGHTLQLTYANGRLTGLTNPAGGSISFGYDAANNLTRVTYEDGTSITYHYENASFPNHLTGATDENQVRYASYGYDTAGRATLSEHAGGFGRVAISYAANSSTVLNAAGGTSVYTFTTATNQSRRLISVVRNGKSRSFALGADVQRRVIQKTDERGTITTYQYDRDHLTSTTEALGTPRERTRTYQYLSPQDSLITYESLSSVASGGLVRETLTTYNAQRLPWVITRRGYNTSGSTDRVTTLTYDTFGRLSSVDGPRTAVNDITTYSYHTCSTGGACGQLETITNALGHITTFNTYDLHGRPTRITDPNGLVTNLAYDLRGRLLSTQVGSETTAFAYYPTGLLRRVTLSDNSYLEYTYNAAHLLTGISDGEGNRVEMTPHISGEGWTVENMYDPSGVLSRARSRVYNSLNQLTQDIGAANQTTIFSYDDTGNVDTVTDPLNRVTDNEFDELNRLMRVTDPALGVTEFEYDADDHLTRVADPRTLTTQYAFNGHGDLMQVASPDTGATQSTYDAAGNVDVRTDARNRSGDHDYDALNRLARIAYADQIIAFEYDQGPNALGRMTRMTDSSGSTDWTYNAQGQVASKQQTIGSLVRSTSYGRNSAGQLTQIATPSGQIIEYGYTNNRITSITVNGLPLLSQVLYEPFGPTRGWTWGNGTLAARDYDTDWQLTTIDSAGRSSYTFFPDGAVRTRTDDNPAAFGIANGTTNYTPATTSNRLASSSGVQARTYGYDAAGNTTSLTGASFVYNDAGRMISATAGGITTSYLLNGLGQRVRKSDSTMTRVFTYDEAGHLVGEYDAMGNLVQETVWLDDIPVATLRPNGTSASIYYVHTDHLNTPRRITRPSDNAILWRWESDPFGQATAIGDADGDGQSFSYNLRFPGQYFDAETGLSHNYARDFDSETGRYVQSDPVGLRGGINTYGYANANPIMRFDSTGLTTVSVDVRAGVMLVDPEVRGRAPYTLPITSGTGECMNNPQCSKDENRGPIPPGDYAINVPELSDPGIIHGILRQFRGDWGDWRVPVHPLPRTQTYGRSGFFLHGGRFKGSAGCIDFGGGVFGDHRTDQLRADLLNDPDGLVPLRVH